MKPKCVNCGKEITGDYVEVLDYRITDVKLYYVRNSWNTNPYPEKPKLQ